jgi:hypothetical protein
MAYLPPARTKGSSIYYMLPVLSAVLLWWAWWTSCTIQRNRERILLRYAVAVCGALIAIGLGYAHVTSSSEALLARRYQSQLFLADHVRSDVIDLALREQRLCFVTDRRDPHPHFFVDSPSAYSLLRWAARAEQQNLLRAVPVTVFSGFDQDATSKAAELGCTPRLVRYPIERNS